MGRLHRLQRGVYAVGMARGEPVVEFDSRAHHDDPLALVHAPTGTDLLAAGCAVLRLTAPRLSGATEHEASRRRTALDRRSRTAGPVA